MNAGNEPGDCHIRDTFLAEESRVTHLCWFFGLASIALFVVVALVSHAYHERKIKNNRVKSTQSFRQLQTLKMENESMAMVTIGQGGFYALSLEALSLHNHLLNHLFVLAKSNRFSL